MLSRIKQFADTTSSGGMYLFTKDDFYMLEAWIFWMIINHEHVSVYAPTTAQNSQHDVQAVTGSSVKMHQIGLHENDAVPVGFEVQLSADSTTYRPHKIDGTVDTLVNREYLTLTDHVTHRGIHTISGMNDPTPPAVEGQLVARGWTKPVLVRAVISSPLFEVMGYTTKGPVIMPFPHYNMSPVVPDVHNRRNQCAPLVHSPVNAPLSRMSHTIGINDNTSPYYFDSDPAISHQSNYIYNIYSKGGFRAFEQEGLLGRYPYPADAKSQNFAPFHSIFQQFLYLIPPYLETELNVDLEFDVITGEQFGAAPYCAFFHTPLFVDSRHTTMLDRINRSGITTDDILNHKDLVGIFMNDTDKADLFSTSSGTTKTCWLSKYSPVLVKDDGAGTGYGCSLVLKEFDQEINQFVSQINYPGSYTRTDGGQYYDHRFKIVTMDFGVYDDPTDDADLLEIVDSADINEFFAGRGFPRCTYLTDFEAYMSRAGGDLDDEFRPKESFSFHVYPTSIWLMKDYLQNTLNKSEISKYYFDMLNVPYGFTNGKRQVLILKDSDVYRHQNLFFRNPYSNMRLQGYMVVEGYVTVPYEIYATSFSIEDAMSAAQMSTAPTLSGSVGEEWHVAPPSEVDNYILPPTAGGDSGGTTVTVLTPGGGGLGDDPNEGGDSPSTDPIITNQLGDNPDNDGTTTTNPSDPDDLSGGENTDPTPAITSDVTTGGTVISVPGYDTTGGTSGSVGNVDWSVFPYLVSTWGPDDCVAYRASGVIDPVLEYICCLSDNNLNWYDFVESDTGDLDLFPDLNMSGTGTDENDFNCSGCQILAECLCLKLGPALAMLTLQQLAPKCASQLIDKSCQAPACLSQYLTDGDETSL